jgi:glyoxylase-like metal-dependent hydrolase (beta-lactamase superfamily II)
MSDPRKEGGIDPKHVVDVGHGITRIAVPTPFAVGRVNCYLVDDDPLTLVDTGPNSERSLAELEAGLTLAGHRVENLERIVLTHQHLDHIGLAGALADRSGAEVVAMAALAPWLDEYEVSMGRDDAFSGQVMRKNGVPSEISDQLKSLTAGFHSLGARVAVTTPVNDGDEVEFASRSWRVLLRPGHSPSDTVFHDEDAGMLIAGDHLLEAISSNPLISRPLIGDTEIVPGDRPPALLIYMESLAKTAGLELLAVHGGHGGAVEDHRGLIARRIAGHERRAEKIAGLLSSGPLTAHQVAEQMWGKVAMVQAYLTLSEVLGHMDLLERDDRVTRVAGAVDRFALAD